MLTLCWAAKGGSGTTVVAAALALDTPGHSMLVDLDGELPAVLGLPEPDRAGIADWLASDAPTDRLGDLTIDVRPGVSLLPWRAAAGRFGHGSDSRDTCATLRAVGRDRSRWQQLARWLTERARQFEVTVDAGTGIPPGELFDEADRTLLVTRPCYLAVLRAVQQQMRPSGVVMVREHGRSLSAREIEHALGCPVEATVTIDPAVARAVDAGLLTGHLPRVIRRELRRATTA